MKLTFIGVGSAFNSEQLQSNALIEADDGRKLLIDAGSTAKIGLERLGFSHRDLDALFVSHLHADHIGALEWLGFATRFDPQFAATKKQLKLYVRSTMVNPLWQSLQGGLRLEAVPTRLSTFFDVVALKANGHFTFSGIRFDPVQTLHYVNDREFMPSYGLRFKTPAGTVFFTGDAVLTPHMLAFYEQADLIFQDCETQAFPTPVHTHYKQLVELPAHIKAKMVLYHFSPGSKPEAQAAGFRGWAVPGQAVDLGSR